MWCTDEFLLQHFHTHGELLVTASINIVYRLRLGLVLLSAVANCGSSNLWETYEKDGLGEGGKRVVRQWQILDQCKDCVSVYK